MEYRTLLEEILVGDKLSYRELQSLEYAARGMTAKETAARWNLSHETVRIYRKRAVAKLGAKNLINAVAIALINDLI